MKTIVPRILLALYALAFATACLYVPWRTTLHGYRGSLALPYAPLWAPPDVGGLVNVDLGRLGLELLALTVVAGVALFLCGGFRGCPARVNAEVTS